MRASSILDCSRNSGAANENQNFAQAVADQKFSGVTFNINSNNYALPPPLPVSSNAQEDLFNYSGFEIHLVGGGNRYDGQKESAVGKDQSVAATDVRLAYASGPIKTKAFNARYNNRSTVV